MTPTMETIEKEDILLDITEITKADSHITAVSEVLEIEERVVITADKEALGTHTVVEVLETATVGDQDVVIMKPIEETFETKEVALLKTIDAELGLASAKAHSIKKRSFEESLGDNLDTLSALKVDTVFSIGKADKEEEGSCSITTIETKTTGSFDISSNVKILDPSKKGEPSTKCVSFEGDSFTESYSLSSIESGQYLSSLSSFESNQSQESSISTSTMENLYRQPKVLSESDTEATTSDPYFPENFNLRFCDTTASEITYAETDSSSLMSVKDTHKAMIVDDIKMNDDMIEVTVSTDDLDEDEIGESEFLPTTLHGELLETQSGSKIVLIGSETEQSVCVCDPVLKTSDMAFQEKRSDSKTKVKSSKESKFKEKARTEKSAEKYSQKYQTLKYDHVESKIKKTYESSTYKKSLKSTSQDYSKPSTSQTQSSKQYKSISSDSKSKTIDSTKTKLQYKPKGKSGEGTVDGTQIHVKKSVPKPIPKARGYMASTLSRDMKVEATTKETVGGSPKHTPLKVKISDERTESTTVVSSPRRRITPLSTPEKKSGAEKKQSEISPAMAKRIPFQKRVENNETKRSATSLPRKEKRLVSETIKKQDQKENKLNKVRSEYKQTIITNLSSSGTEKSDKSETTPVKRLQQKTKRKGVTIEEIKEETLTERRKEVQKKSTQENDSKTTNIVRTSKQYQSTKTISKQKNKERLIKKDSKDEKNTKTQQQISKYIRKDSEAKIDSKKTSSKTEVAEEIIQSTKVKLTEDTASPKLEVEREDPLSTKSHSLIRSALLDTSISSSVEVPPLSSDDSSKNVKRAASAPIGAVSSYMEEGSPISGRRGSGPPRGQMSDRILDRHSGLECGKGPSSLPSSPSRMRSQTQCGSIQLLTSEVFTRTVDATGGIEVIFRQPNDPIRRLPKSDQLHSDLGEFSMIDTTDSSLSDSVALPSSSSDHDLSVDTSYRLRTSISPGSPKFSRRARDTMSPKIRQSDIVECATVPEGDTLDTDLSPIKSSPSVTPNDRQPSTPTKLVERSGSGRTPTRSEDRLSPILDVHSVTPPRLKHKFMYASSDEEEFPLGKPPLDNQPSSSQVVMEPSSVHSMPLPSEITSKSIHITEDSNNIPQSILELDSPLGIVEDSVSVEIFEEDVINDEIPTVSTSGSDVDYALLESNQLKAFYEEEATDEDPEGIPKDDSIREDTIICQVDQLTQEDISGECTTMATEESIIPVISITTTDDTNQVLINKNPYQASPEPLTDIEDLDHELDHTFLGKLKISNEDDGGLTDAEVMEASDDENDPGYLPTISVQLDDIIDYGGTYEELVRISSPQSKHKKGKVVRSVSTSNEPQAKGLLSTFYEKDGITDYEDFDLSDEEDNADEEEKQILEDEDILDRLIDDETVAISDLMRKTPTPSPSVTPEPGVKRREGKGSKKGFTRKKKSNYNLLSPRSLSPHLSDITDTEIVYSDSDEEAFMKQRPISPQERRRRLRKEDVLQNSKQKVVETTSSHDTSTFPELEISSVHISEKVPVRELVSESDTDNAYSAPRKHKLYAPKKKTLLMEVAGALMKDTFAGTDVEQFEGSNESDDDGASQASDSNCNVVDSQYGSVKEQEIVKDKLRLPKQDKIILTDTEVIETEDDSAELEQVGKPSKIHTSQEEDVSTEEDDIEATDLEYLAAVKELRARAWKENNYEIRFIEVDGQTRPLAITPDLPHTTPSSSLLPPTQVKLYTTDTEDLLGESDEDVSKTFLGVHSMERDTGLTDTEVFEGEDDMSRPKSPEPSDDEESQVLPEPTREMVLMKEDPCGRPVSVVLPLGNVIPGGLRAPKTELEGGVSEVEDMMTDDDDALTAPTYDLCPTPEIPDFEGGIIHSSEVMKVQKKKLKVLGEGLPEPLTDTEDIYLSATGKRRRSKAKLKLGLEVKHSSIRQELTDTEDLMLSDAESQRKGGLSIPLTDAEPVTDLDDVDFSGEEEIQDKLRSSAVTPEFLKELGESYTTLKEGSGPFTEEARQHFLSLSNVPVIHTISPSPDSHFMMNTDTEDMVTSADEDGFSRAETVTPFDTGLELEDPSSFVYMKHTRKFDYDAPEEAMHVKGAVDIHDSHTDVEDLGMLSEDERPRPPDQLFVNDTKDQVCVCLSSEVEDEDSVCVCVSKEHGGLSLVWNSKNSTDSKQHRDWAEKGKPDSTIDTSHKESEEALLDLAAGLQDNKGSGSGPSSTK